MMMMMMIDAGEGYGGGFILEDELWAATTGSVQFGSMTWVVFELTCPLRAFLFARLPLISIRIKS